MNIENEEKSENIEKNNSTLIEGKSPDNSKKSKNQILSGSNNTKKDNKKRNRRRKNEKSKNLNNNISKELSNISSGILSEIKQIKIPTILSEKEDLFKILQIEIINIDKAISLLNKKKKYYNEIMQKLNNDIQNEKKNLKKNEIKNKEYLFMENILKNYEINDCFEYSTIDNSYYNMSKQINESLDFDYFLNNNNYEKVLVINNFNKNISNQINNKMEPNIQLTYEEFNNISEFDNNFCLLMNNFENNSVKNNIDEKKDEDLQLLSDVNKSEDKNKIINDYKGNNNNYKKEFKPEKEEFDIIDEVPPEEEDTNNKKNNKRKSIPNDKEEQIKNDYNNNENNIKDFDFNKSINKNYSNNFEELDFYLLKDSKIKETKENKKKKITFDDIQKKYKTQDMGSDFENVKDDNNIASENEKKNIKEKKKEIKKNKKIDKEKDLEEKEENSLYNSDNNINESDFSDFTYSNEISKDESGDNKSGEKKKRGRKKKKNNTKIFSVEEELPDPENLDSIALALEMKKYGMKPQNKKKNIEILKGVYKFLKIKELPEFISRKLTTFDLDIEDNIERENDSNINSKKQEDNSCMTELTEEQKKNIIDIIKENKTIYEKILLFKEISLKEIKSLLNSKGIIIPNKLLSQLLLNSGAILPGGWNDKK